MFSISCKTISGNDVMLSRVATVF
uniref:Uncharacterized protein n=1 Tax=Anguilla anguilla TaxID=7936 RepID=A0A0E9UGQ6_ANGAN